MAYLKESNVADFNVLQLRGVDAAYLQGATRPTIPALPSVMAYGPRRVQCPVDAGGLGVGDEYAAGFDLPARPDLVWIAVQCDVAVRYASSGKLPQQVYCYLKGDPDQANSYLFPAIGDDALIVSHVDDGGFQRVPVASPSVARSLWIPLMPEDTADGWQFVVTVVASATETTAQYGYSMELRHVRFLGYPVNAWKTGVLQHLWSQRGS